MVNISFIHVAIYVLLVKQYFERRIGAIVCNVATFAKYQSLLEFILHIDIP